jgi:hypothetical protein
MAFPKNHVPWNKGLKYDESMKSRLNMDGLSLGNLQGELNQNWKGNEASYSALHYWVVRKKGKAVICVDCGSSKKVEWANISGEYRRDELDYKSLCKKCHNVFDNHRWGQAKSFYRRKEMS